MGEIGLGQFIKNAFNYSIGKPPTQPQAQHANENFQQTQQAAMKMLNQTVQNIQRNFIQQADIMNTQMQLKQLTDLERSLMLKEFFDFPKDMKDLVELLLKTNTTQILSAKDIAELMNKNIDMAKLAQLLQSHGKEAAEKITKLIATLHQSGIYNTQQLKEMSALINACIPAPDTSSAVMIKSLMLMYLPWLPLSGEPGFNIGFEENEESESSDSENIVTILITTKNYGQVKVVILKQDNDLDIDVTCNENFPKKDFHDALKNGAAGFDTEKSVSFTTRKSRPEDENDERKINFTNSVKISPHLLLVVHTIINIIVELDKKADLLSERKNMADS